MRINQSYLFIALLLAGCSVKTIKDDPTQAQKIDWGVMEVDSKIAAQGTMVAWNNAAVSYPLQDQWKYGIEFAFDLKINQPVYLYLDSEQNYDCNIGAKLMGPSYYLKLADGSELAFDYESRALVEKFPGSGDFDFPGLLPAGEHSLIARWFSNEECRMDVAVTAKDRFSPNNNHGPAIQRVDLLGSWENGDLSYTYDLAGLLTVAELTGTDTAVLEVIDFPYHERYTAKVRSVSGSSLNYSVDEVFYCAYEIDAEASPGEMKLSCNPAGNTSVPSVTADPQIFTR